MLIAWNQIIFDGCWKKWRFSQISRIILDILFIGKLAISCFFFWIDGCILQSKSLFGCQRQCFNKPFSFLNNFILYKEVMSLHCIWKEAVLTTWFLRKCLEQATENKVSILSVGENQNFRYKFGVLWKLTLSSLYTVDPNNKSEVKVGFVSPRALQCKSLWQIKLRTCLSLCRNST